MLSTGGHYLPRMSLPLRPCRISADPVHLRDPACDEGHVAAAHRACCGTRPGSPVSVRSHDRGNHATLPGADRTSRMRSPDRRSWSASPHARPRPGRGGLPAAERGAQALQDDHAPEHSPRGRGHQRIEHEPASLVSHASNRRSPGVDPRAQLSHAGWRIRTHGQEREEVRLYSVLREVEERC